MKHYTTRAAALLAALAFCAASAWAAMSDAEFVELCEKGTAEQVKQALGGGAKANAETEEGSQTALMAAAGANPDAGAVRALLAAGADMNKRDDGNMNALMHATRNTPAVARALLDAGAKLNEQDGDTKETALMYAALWGRAEMVSLLLEAGANPRLKDAEGHDALWYAQEGAREKQREELFPDAAARQAEDGRIIRMLEDALRGGAKKPAAKKKQ